MFNLDKKYFWVGLGVIIFTLVAILTLKFGNSSQFTGNILGTPEEYQNYKTEVETKISAIEQKIAKLNSDAQTNSTKTEAEKTEILDKISDEEKRLTPIKTALAESSEASAESNQKLYDQLAILNDIISVLNSITEKLSQEQISCPLNETSSPNYTEASNYLDYLSNVTAAIDLLGAKTNFGESEETLLEGLFTDLLVLSGEYEEGSVNCFVLSDPDSVESSLGNTFSELNMNSKINTINDTIEIINQGPIKCAKALSCSEIQNLEEVVLPATCPAGTTRNISTGECNTPPACPVTDAYTKFDIIYAQLQIFATMPNNFDAAQKSILINNLSAANAKLSTEEADLYSPFLTSFNYTTQANTLINTLNGTITRYASQNPLCAKNSFVQLTIAPTQTTPPTDSTTTSDTDIYDEPLSCPADSEYFEDACICLESLLEVEPNGSCSETDPSTLPEVEDVESTTTQVTCADGTVVDDILACIKEDSPSTPDPDVENLLGSAEDPLSLDSNTDPNVMYSATVQGETGLEPIFFLIFFFVGAFNIYIWLK